MCKEATVSFPYEEQKCNAYFYSELILSQKMEFIDTLTG